MRTGFRFSTIIGLALLAVLAAGRFWSSWSDPTESGPADLAVPVGPQVPPELQVDRWEQSFPAGGTLQDVLSSLGFSPGEIHDLVNQTRDVYDLNKVKAGRLLTVERYRSGAFRSLEYAVDEEHVFRVALEGDRFYGTLKKRPLQVKVAGFYGVIEDNFYNAVVALGESSWLPMEVLEILRWDIDFTTIQPSDSFKLLVEKKFYADEFVAYGDIQAVEFNSGGKSFRAYLFPDPKTGKNRYFDDEGKSVRKAFLRVPFQYDYRISSGFSYSRFHPIQRQRRPHLGIDYAAPYGTPVLASAQGRVVFAGYKGANGNMVRIRHPNGYSTYYLHLSKIYVRSGHRVSQGQRIGAVGASGGVTGTHLDYRIQDPRGRFLNPRKMVALPSDSGVPKNLMEEFIAVRDAIKRHLEVIAEVGPNLSRIVSADD